MRYVPGSDDYLSPVEREVHAQQVREHGCAVCRHRLEVGRAFGVAVYDCAKGLRRPRQGRRCPGFRLDEEA